MTTPKLFRRPDRAFFGISTTADLPNWEGKEPWVFLRDLDNADLHDFGTTVNSDLLEKGFAMIRIQQLPLRFADL